MATEKNIKVNLPPQQIKFKENKLSNLFSLKFYS